MDNVPVDVAPADPFERVRGDVELGAAATGIEPRRFLRPGESSAIEEVRRLADYEHPPNSRLDELEEPMTVTCHVSPDCGWSVLSGFLFGVTKTLTVAMHDFTAPHISKAVRMDVKPRSRSLRLVLDSCSASSDGGREGHLKADDLP